MSPVSKGCAETDLFLPFLLGAAAKSKPQNRGAEKRGAEQRAVAVRRVLALCLSVCHLPNDQKVELFWRGRRPALSSPTPEQISPVRRVGGRVDDDEALEILAHVAARPPAPARPRGPNPATRDEIWPRRRTDGRTKEGRLITIDNSSRGLRGYAI